ncbi:MAG: T9SS type A sorting domain-containing protein [Melioribacteraceae bacterium]
MKRFFLLFVIISSSVLFAQSKSTKENHAPVFVKEMPDTTILPGKTLIYQYKAVDPDGDSITYSAKSALPINAVFIPATGYFSWLSANSQIGRHEIIIEASDGKLTTSSKKAIITVQVLVDIFGSVDYICNPTNGGKIATSYSGDTTVVRATTNSGFKFSNWAINGQAVSTDSVYAFKMPNLLYVTITANFRVNRAPVFVKEMPDTAIMATAKYFFKYEAVDPDGDSLKFYASTQLPNSSALLENGQFAWRPSNNDFIYANKSEVIVYVTDGNLKTFSRKTTLRIREVSSIEEKDEVAKEFSLSQNHPNPFNPETTIEYTIPKAEHVTLKVFDVLGREIATLVDEYKQAGTYNSKFSIINYNLSSGVYFYQLRAGNPSAGSGQGFVETKKLCFIK